MKKFKFKINGTKFEVDVRNVDGYLAELDVNGSRYHVELEKEVIKVKTPTIVKRSHLVSDREKTLDKSNTSISKIIAPLPGNILSVKVNVGDEIKKGSLLLVLEAMKMENNIASDVEGVVKSIKVKDGDTVLQNDLLVEISI